MAYKVPWCACGSEEGEGATVQEDDDPDRGVTQRWRLLLARGVTQQRRTRPLLRLQNKPVPHIKWGLNFFITESGFHTPKAVTYHEPTVL